jgi:hypothetical protein
LICAGRGSSDLDLCRVGFPGGPSSSSRGERACQCGLQGMARSRLEVVRLTPTRCCIFERQNHVCIPCTVHRSECI